MKYQKGTKPTWKIILNSQFKLYGHVTTFIELVKETGYPLFEWNGRIYELKDGHGEDTGWLAEEIE